MTTITTPKTAAFSSLVQKTGILHAEILTLDTAIRERDAIKVLMADCGDETEARKHLGDLMRAEETVIIKQARLPRQQDDFADLVAQTLYAYDEANMEWYNIISSTPKLSAQAFRDLLLAAELDPETQKVENANPVVVDAIRPLALASKLDDLLTEAWRAATITTDLAERRVAGLQDAVKWLDKLKTAHAELLAEDKRMVAACDAFLKVLAKG